MLGLLTTVIVAPKPRLTLRATSQKADPSFRDTLGKAQAVWVDGRDSGLRVPAFLRVEERSNRRGDLAGTFMEDFRGAMDGTWNHPFFKPKGGRLRLLPVPRDSDNPGVLAIDARGRVLALDDPQMNGELTRNLDGYCRAHLWANGVWIDLGAADDLRFLKDGAVFGYFWADTKSRPLSPGELPPEALKVWFRWRAGRRTLFHA